MAEIWILWKKMNTFSSCVKNWACIYFSLKVSLFYKISSHYCDYPCSTFLATDMTWSDDLTKIYNYEAQQNLVIIEFNKRKTK